MAEDHDPEAKAKEIAEWVIADLKASPGDMLVIRPPEGWRFEECKQLREALVLWSEEQGLFFHWLVLPPGSDIGVVHTLTDEELARAGAEGFPGQGQPGMVADTSRGETEEAT